MEVDRIFQGSIPALYDQHLGPMIFAPYADDLASRLADLQHGRILETAAGTGVVTRALVSALPEGLLIEATDLNQPMIEYASSQLLSPRVTCPARLGSMCQLAPIFGREVMVTLPDRKSVV